LRFYWSQFVCVRLVILYLVYFLFVTVWLSVPVQLIAWKNSSPKLSVMCRVGRQLLWSVRPNCFDVLRHFWSNFEPFTGKTSHFWWIALSDKSLRRQPQMINHTVQSCPMTKLADDGLSQLHSADVNAVMWLRDVAMKAFVK